MKKYLAVLLILIISCSILVSCKDPILEGTYVWYVDTYALGSITFYPDNTCIKTVMLLDDENGTYTFDGTNLVINYADEDISELVYDAETDSFYIPGVDSMKYIREK